MEEPKGVRTENKNLLSLKDKRIYSLTENTIVLILFISILFLPFWSTSKLFGYPKIDLMGVLWAVWVPFTLLLIARRRILRDGLRPNLRTTTFLLSFLGWLLLVLVWAEDKKQHWAECSRFLSFTGALIPLYLLLATSEEEFFRRLLRSVQSAILITFAMTGSIQLLYSLSGCEIFGEMIGHKNIMASLLSIGSLWAVSSIIFTSEKRLPLLPLTTFLLCFLPLPFTDARASILTSLLLVSLVAVTQLRNRPKTVLTVLLPTVTVFLGLLFVEYKDREFWRRKHRKQVSRTEKLLPLLAHKDQSLRSRFLFWRELRERTTFGILLLGRGFRKWPLSYEGGKADPNPNLIHEHNEMLRFILSIGFIGFFWFILFTAHIFYLSRKLYNILYYKHIAVGVVLALTTYFILGVVDCLLLHKRVLFIYGLLISVFLGVYARSLIFRQEA